VESSDLTTPPSHNRAITSPSAEEKERPTKLEAIVGTAEPIDVFASKAAIVNARHRKLVQDGLEYLQEMISIGGELAEIKDELKHGHWEHWVAEHLTFNIRTAQR
jgi:hypothetical protein